MSDETGTNHADRPKYPLLAATAYLLVPGERRRKAKGHFRKAGFEAMKGVGVLAKPVGQERGPAESGTGKRQSISID